MYPTTFNTETELSAVNSILGSIGQAPVQSLTFENPEVSFVYNILKETTVDVQSEGWGFNSEYEYPFTPNDKGYIPYPENVLRLDITCNSIDRSYDPVKRNGRLYDKQAHTDVWSKEIKADVVWELPFKELPTPFKRYITYRAAGRAAAQLVGNAQLVQLLNQQEGQARAVCMEYECEQGDYSFMGTPRGVSYRPFKPYNTLAR